LCRVFPLEQPKYWLPRAFLPFPYWLHSHPNTEEEAEEALETFNNYYNEGQSRKVSMQYAGLL
jgi:hypothetical protein